MKAIEQETVKRMRIQCPSCAATYEVAAGLLEKPRTVRCAQCRHDWVATAMPNPDDAPAAAEPPVPASAVGETADRALAATATAHDAAGPALSLDEFRPHAAEPTTDEADPADALPDGPSPLSDIAGLSRGADSAHASARRERLLAPAWIASVSLVLTFLALGYAKKEQVMEHWPASKRVYAVLGLAPAAPDAGAQKH